MPRNEDAYSHPDRSGLPGGTSAPMHKRSGSLTNLARLPGVARAKLHNSLTHNPFVRFIDDSDGQDKDENDIYRHKASCHQNSRGCCSALQHDGFVGSRGAACAFTTAVTRIWRPCGMPCYAPPEISPG